MQKKMIAVTLTISVDEDTLGEAWQLLGKLNSICEITGSGANPVLEEIEKKLEADLIVSGYIPF